MKRRSLDVWLTEYRKTHRHPTNKKIHNFCVPLIMFSTIGLIRALPVPWSASSLTWDFFFLVACYGFYFSLSPVVGFFMVALTVMMVLVLMQLETIGILLPVCLGIFVLAWIGQFIGHKIEGKKPSFFDDLAFLLIGPIWVFEPLLRRFM